MKACILTGTKKFKELKDRYNLSEEALKGMIQKWQDKHDAVWESANDVILEEYIKQRTIGEPILCKSTKDYEAMLKVYQKYASREFTSIEQATSHINNMKQYMDSKYIHLYTDKNGKIHVDLSAPVYEFSKIVNATHKASFDVQADILPIKNKLFSGVQMIKALKSVLPASYIPILETIESSVSNTVVELKDGMDSKTRGEIVIGENGEYKIYINSNFTPGEKAKTILHELIHAGSLKAIRENPKLKESLEDYIKEIEKIINKKIKGTGTVHIPHGFKSAEEFVAEFFSNEEFQKMLKETEPVKERKFNSLFDEICDFFKSIFDSIFNKNHDYKNAYEQIAPVMKKIIDLQNKEMQTHTMINKETATEMSKIKAKALEEGTFMKAPNGKPSKLNERQWLYVRTKAFKEWFGDWEKAYKEKQKLEAFKNQEFFTYKNEDGETIRATAVKLENGKYRIIFKHEDGRQWDYIAEAEFVKQKGIDGVISYLNSGVKVTKSTPEEYLGKPLESLIKTDASKVIDENSEPLVVYHGNRTDKKIVSFDKSKIGSEHKKIIDGFWFITDKNIAKSEYSVKPESRGKGEENLKYGEVLPVFLNIKNPVIETQKGLEVKDSPYGEMVIAKEKLVEFINRVSLNSEDNDGFILTLKDSDPNSDPFYESKQIQIIVKEPNQIKSAEYNTGEFSTASSNIYKDAVPTNPTDTKGKIEMIKSWEKTILEYKKEYDLTDSDNFTHHLKEGAVVSNAQLKNKGLKNYLFRAQKDAPTIGKNGYNEDFVKNDYGPKIIEGTFNNEKWYFVPLKSASATKKELWDPYEGQDLTKNEIKEAEKAKNRKLGPIGSLGETVDSLLRFVLKHKHLNPLENEIDFFLKEENILKENFITEGFSLEKEQRNNYKEFIEQALVLKKYLKSIHGENCIFITDDMPFTGDRIINEGNGESSIIPCVGKPDLIILGEDGSVTIYDFKTNHSKLDEKNIREYTLQTMMYQELVDKYLKSKGIGAIFNNPKIIKINTHDWYDFSLADSEQYSVPLKDVGNNQVVLKTQNEKEIPIQNTKINEDLVHPSIDIVMEDGKNYDVSNVIFDIENLIKKVEKKDAEKLLNVIAQMSPEKYNNLIKAIKEDVSATATIVSAIPTMSIEENEQKREYIEKVFKGFFEKTNNLKSSTVNLSNKNSIKNNIHNLCSHPNLTSKEIKFCANSIMYLISHNIIDKLQKDPNAPELLGKKANGEYWVKPSKTVKGKLVKIDYTKMTRAEIIRSVGGINTMLDYVKEMYFNPSNDVASKQREWRTVGKRILVDPDVNIAKLRVLYDNFNSLVALGYSKLISLEGLTVIEARKTKIVIDGIEYDHNALVNISSDKANELILDGTDDQTLADFENALEEKDQEFWQQKQISVRSSLSADMKRLFERMPMLRVVEAKEGTTKKIEYIGESKNIPKQKVKYTVNTTFGFFEHISPGQAVETLLKQCWQCTTLEEMIGRLKDLADNSPDGKDHWIYNIIGYDQTDENGNVIPGGLHINGILNDSKMRQQFFQCFRKDFNTYSIVLTEYDPILKMRKTVTKYINTNEAVKVLMQNYDASMYSNEHPFFTRHDSVTGAGIIDMKDPSKKATYENAKNRFQILKQLINNKNIYSKVPFGTGNKYYISNVVNPSTHQSNIDILTNALLNALKSLGLDGNIITRNAVAKIINKDKFKPVSSSTISRIVSDMEKFYGGLDKNIANQEEILKAMENTTDGNQKALLEEQLYYNPFMEGDSNSKVCVRPSLQNIIKIIGNDITTSIESSSYENGKMRYSFTNPSYLGKMMLNLRNALGDKNKFEEYLKNEFGRYKFFAETEKDDINGEEVVSRYRCPWLQMLVNNENDREVFERKSTLAYDKTEYVDLSPTKYMMEMISEYFYSLGSTSQHAWYRIPILSNKPSSEYIRFRKFNAPENSGDSNSGFKNILTGRKSAKGGSKYMTDIFMQEMDRIKTVIMNTIDDSYASIDNFDIKKGEARDNISRKLKNQETLVLEDFVKDGKLLFENSGASFKFIPYFNKEFLKGDTRFMELFLKYINAGIKENRIEAHEIGELQKEFQNLFYKKEDGVESGYMAEIEKSEKEKMKKLGIYDTEKIQKTIPVPGRNPVTIDITQYVNIAQYGREGCKIPYLIQQFCTMYTKLNEKTDEEIKKLAEEFIQGSIEKSIDRAMSEFIWNDMFASINIIQLSTTDLAFYKNAEDFQKRFAEVYSPTLKLDKSAEFEKNGQKIRYSADGMARSVTIKDRRVVSETFMAANALFKNRVEEAKRTDPNSSDFVELDTMGALISTQFLDINETDAQAYSGPTSFRKKLGMAGRWSDEMEEAYQNVISGNYNIADLKVLMQPIKPFLYGQMIKQRRNESIKVPVQNKNSEYMIFLAEAILRGSEHAADNKLIALSDFMENSAYDDRIIFRKGSFYKNGIKVTNSPEIETLKKRRKNNSSYEVIEEGVYNGKGIDTIQFDSAVKVGNQGVIDISNIKEYDDIINILNSKCYNLDSNNNRIIDPKKNLHNDTYNMNHVHHVDFDDYGIQQEVPAHLSDHEQLYGSQIRILGITDISVGTILNIKDEKLNAYDEVNATGKLFKEGVLSEYQNLFNENILESLNKLKKEFLLDPKGKDRKEYIVNKITKIINKPSTHEQGYFGEIVEFLSKMKTNYMLTETSNDQTLINNLGLLFIDYIDPSKEMSKETVTEKLNAIEKHPDKFNFSISKEASNEALSKILLDGISKDQRYGSDMVRACTIDPATHDFVIPLSDPVQSVRVQQLIHSIIKSRLNKQKIAGGPVVQASSFGMSDNLHIIMKDESTGERLKTFEQFCKDILRSTIMPQIYENKVITPEAEKYQKYLQYTDYESFNPSNARKLAVQEFEVYMPVTSEDLLNALTKRDENGKPTGELMTPIEAIENGVIQGKIIDRSKGIFESEQLKAIGYRIPTEDKYSMMPMKIVGFVPPAAGEVVIMPKEITLLTGSDFDIDKMYIMLKAFKYENFKNKKGRDKLKVKEAIDAFIEESKTEVNAKNIHIIRKTLTKKHEDNEDYKDDENKDLINKVLNFYNRRVNEFTKKSTFTEITHERSIVGGKIVNTGASHESRNNRIFDIQWSILTNSDTLPKIFNPGSFDPQKKMARVVTILRDDELKNKYTYEELMEKDLSELNKIAEGVTSNICLSSTQVKFFKQNMVAGKLIGVFANNNVGHGFCSLAYVKGKPMKVVPVTEKSGFSLFGITVSKDSPIVLDALYDRSGRNLISKNIAGYLAASVDAVKDPVLNFLNLNTATAGVAMSLIRMGFTIEETSIFLTQPILIELIERYEKENSDGYADLSKIIRDLYNERNNTTQGKRSTMNDRLAGLEKNSVLNLDSLVEQFKDPNPLVQDTVLLTMYRLLEVGKELNDLTFMTKFNSMRNAVGPNISNTLVLRRKVADFMSKKITLIEGSKDIISDNPILEAFLKYPQEACESILGDRFPHYTNEFQTIINIMENTTGRKLKPEDIDLLVSDYMLAKLTLHGEGEYDFDSVFSVDDESKLDLINFPETFSKFCKMHPELLDTKGGNEILKNIRMIGATRTCKYTTLETSTGSMPVDYLDDLKDAWADLSRCSDPKLQEQARSLSTALFFYNLFRSGFGFSPKTFLHLANTDVKLSIKGYIERIRDPRLYNDRIDPMSFVNQFLRNNSHLRKFVNEINDKGKPFSMTIANDILTISPKEGFKYDFSDFGTVVDNSMHYKQVIKYNGVLYDDPIFENSVLTYRKTTTLGIANNFKEYDANKGAWIKTVFTNVKSVYEEDESADFINNFESTTNGELPMYDSLKDINFYSEESKTRWLLNHILRTSQYDANVITLYNKIQEALGNLQITASNGGDITNALQEYRKEVADAFNSIVRDRSSYNIKNNVLSVLRDHALKLENLSGVEKLEDSSEDDGIFDNISDEELQEQIKNILDEYDMC